LGSTVFDACVSCRGEAVAAGLADGFASTVVLVVGGDVADPGVQPLGVVLLSGVVEFEGEFARVTDLLQVRPLGLDVSEQRLDPGLVGRRATPPRCPRRPTSGCSALPRTAKYSARLQP